MATYFRVSRPHCVSTLFNVRRRQARLTLGLILFLSLGGFAGAPVGAAGDIQSQQGSSAKEIVTAPNLWGKDFPAILANISSWEQVEQKIVIFPTLVLGNTAYRTSAEAERAAAVLNGSLRPDARLKVSAMRWFEDDSFRVVVDGGRSQFLPENLSLATIKERLGPPENTSRVIITDSTERRPLLLLLHSYSGGNVVYAESGDSPFPGRINRVFLNVTSVIRAIR